MQVSDEIIKVLDYLGQKIGLTFDWTSNNILPYLEQLCGKYIRWEIGTSIAWIAMAILSIVIAFIFSKFVNWAGCEKVIFWCAVIIAVVVIGVRLCIKSNFFRLLKKIKIYKIKGIQGF